MKRTFGPAKQRIKTKLRKSDVVQVLCGKDKGKSGKILHIDHYKGRVLVEKINMVKKTQRPSQEQQKGAIIEMEAAVDISNVMLVDPKGGKRTRIGYRTEGDVKVRFAKNSKKTL